jgi:hypothetical protein
MYFVLKLSYGMGMNPNYPKYHRNAIRSALKGKEFEDAIFEKNYTKQVWEDFKRQIPINFRRYPKKKEN